MFTNMPKLDSASALRSFLGCQHSVYFLNLTCCIFFSARSSTTVQQCSAGSQLWLGRLFTPKATSALNFHHNARLHLPYVSWTSPVLVSFLPRFACPLWYYGRRFLFLFHSLNSASVAVRERRRTLFCSLLACLPKERSLRKEKNVVMDKLTSMLDKFGRDLEKYPLLVKAEEKTNCPKQYLVLSVGSVLLACLLMGFGANLIWWEQRQNGFLVCWTDYCACVCVTIVPLFSSSVLTNRLRTSRCARNLWGALPCFYT